jgi:serine protease Do
MNENRKLWRINVSRRYWLVAAVLLVVASLTFSLAMQGPVVADTQDRAIASAAETGKAFSAVTKSVAPAVVFIRATKQQLMTGDVQGFGRMDGQIPDELLRRFFGDRMPDFQKPRRSEPMVGQGSGFIISGDGYILTNNHVVGGADKLEVTLHDGRILPAELVGSDARTDVAIIKIEAGDLQALPLGDSDKIEVGEWVLAVGSPFGLAGTVTSGIVSAKGRDRMGITDYEEFIQTDAAINPGNSGGPLVNLKGEAIGINTAILSRTGSYNGIGFAIPMNMAKQICEQLIANGVVTRGYLGVLIQPLTPELAKAFATSETTGVLVSDITDGGPAASAGVQRGDVIVELDGEPVKDMTSFRNRVALIQPESQARLVVLRDGNRRTISVEVGRLPEENTPVSRTTAPATSLGISVQTLNDQLADKLGLTDATGVVVTNVSPDSEAAAKGIRPGNVIKEVDRKVIETARQFSAAIEAGQKSGSVLLLVQTDQGSRYVVLKLAK